MNKMKIFMQDLFILAEKEGIHIDELVLSCVAQGVTSWFVDLDTLSVIYGELR